VSPQLSPELLEVLAHPATRKVIATLDEDGSPHAVPSPFLHARPDGLLVHFELLETSATNRNLLRGLWFDRKLSVTVVGPLGQTFVIKAVPVKAEISGPAFSRAFDTVRSVLGDADLSAVWLLRPHAIVDETYTTRKRDEEQRYPFSIHLDRLLLPCDHAPSDRTQP
jgi:hypothetical protein